MANLDLGSLLYPVAVGGISAGAELFSQHHVAKPPAGGVNQLMANAGMAVDIILPVAAVINHTSMNVVKGQASGDLLASSVAIGVRRLTTYLGHKVLKLNVTPTPGAYGAHRGSPYHMMAPRARQAFPAFSPGAVTEGMRGSRLDRKFSVT